MLTNKTNLTLEEFWALPPGDTAYELVDGKVIPKVSPKYFHSSLQRSFDRLISAWCRSKERIRAPWAVSLKRNGRDWVPVPDLTYISYKKPRESPSPSRRGMNRRAIKEAQCLFNCQ